MQNTGMLWIGAVTLGMLHLLMFPLPTAEGVGWCREANCGGQDEQKVPKEKDWKECRKQDTFKGCCKRYSGSYDDITRTGFPTCCWNGTPSTAEGSTTTIEARGGDVYQSATRGLPCSELQKP